jgi:phosphoribosylformimino-5-aminoimidazole carboxamide ribotide isomerase
MILYTAIDILEGKAVRLEQGDFGRRREYADDPLDAARAWVEAGARRLHVVDLDGARSGRPVNIEQLGRIASELGSSTDLIQFGGGLRSVADVAAAFAAGAGRIVLGTSAFGGGTFLSDLIAEHGERVAVGVDIRDGRVAVQGWRERTSLETAEAIAMLAQAGAGTIVYTSVDRDGTLGGLQAAPIMEVSRATGDRRLLYSGGVGSLEDLRMLASLELPNLEGVIVGKALYEGRFTVADAQAALAGAPTAPAGGGG